LKGKGGGIERHDLQQNNNRWYLIWDKLTLVFSTRIHGESFALLETSVSQTSNPPQNFRRMIIEKRNRIERMSP
jgi:hypothetical protein